MDKTFLGILDNHVQEINKSADPKDANDILLRTVKLLLDKVDYSGGILNACDKMETRKIFSSFGKIARSACDFFQASKEHLDPVALNGEIGRNLTTTTQEVIRVNALLESIETTNADLLKKKDELAKINEKYEKVNGEVSRLKKIKETVSDEVIKSREAERVELEKTIKQNQKITNDLESHIKGLENTLQAVVASGAKASADKKAIEENVTQTINTRIEQVKRIFDEHSVDINDLIAKIEDYKRKFAQLGDKFLEVKDIHSFYALHLGENSKIVSKLKEYGISKIGDIPGEIDRLRKSIEDGLKHFDDIIKKALDEQEKIKEDIIRRNGTSN